MSVHVPEPESPARALEPQALERLSSWLKLEDARGELSMRNEQMPSVFKNQRYTDRLCASCNSIPWRDIKAAMLEERVSSKSKPAVYHLLSLQEIAASALAGCHFCVLILLVTFSRNMGGLEVPRWAETQKRQQLGSVFGHREIMNSGYLALPHAVLSNADLSKTCTMYLRRGGDGYHRSDYWTLDFHIEGVVNYGCLQVTHATDPDPPPAVLRQNPTSISYGNHWIRQCMASHTTCAAIHYDVPLLPTRVVYVGELDKDHEPRLHVTNGERARYVALSHCWASSRSLQTTTSNIHAHQQRLEVTEMSQTFRDAIKITIGLGLSFLWIDCLCIIQDSQEDWVSESAKMSDIYRHAFLTISAFSSVDGHGTCTMSYKQTLVDLPCRVLPDLYVHEDDQAYNLPYRTQGVLQTRGWILQEEQLSPRMLHCGNDHLIWNCGESVSRHDRPWFHNGEYFGRNMRYDQSWQQQPFAYWRQLVRMYSHRNLSFATDKLPAISGLAAWFSAVIQNRQSDYLAGIWREDLLQSLLWTRGSDASDSGYVPTDRTDSNKAAYTGPSWSWASRDGPLSFESEDNARNGGLRCGGPRQYSGSWLAKVILAEVALQGASPYGQVKSGKLILRGPVLHFPFEVAARETPPRREISPPPPPGIHSSPPGFPSPPRQEIPLPRWEIPPSPTLGTPPPPPPPPLSSEAAFRLPPPPPRLLPSTEATSAISLFSPRGVSEKTGAGIPPNFFPPSSNEQPHRSKDREIHLDNDDYVQGDRVLLRLNARACLVLEPVGKTPPENVYRRIGLCTMPVSYRRDDWISSDGWRDETVTII